MLHFVEPSWRTLVGYLDYLRTGSTSQADFKAMRQLYCQTNGRANDLLAALSRAFHPVRRLDLVGSVFGEANEAERRRVVRQIRRDGFAVLQNRLPESMVSELIEFAQTTPTRPLGSSAADTLSAFTFEYLSDRTYDRTHVVSAKYALRAQLVVEQAAVQQLLMDPLLLSIADVYLRSEAITDDVSMWWSTAYLRGESSSAAAQHYHFDMDRIKFVKFFFYLTDVSTRNGPHCYVVGSHKRKPRALLRDERIADSEMRQYYHDDRFVEITGPRGTIIAADTRGFHKGKAVIEGERLMLEFEFATSLFGAEWSALSLSEKFGMSFRQAVERSPRRYATFVR